MLQYLSDCHTDLQNLVLVLLSTLQIHPAARLLYSSNGRTLFSELSRLYASVTSDEFDFNSVKPLLRAVLADSPDDTLIWHHVCNAVTETTPPRRPIPSPLKQTPWSQNTSSFVNSSEYRQNVDLVLKLELGPLYVGLPNFCETFFGDVSDLKAASQAVFLKCTEGENPLFKDGWTGWPASAKKGDVLIWFGGIIPKLEAFAGDRMSTLAHRRKLLAQPKTPLQGSIGKRSMDIGFVDSEIICEAASEDGKYRWSHILVPGELKSNWEADKPSIAWIDLATYAREVLAAQDTRRFVLGFTLCGSRMRIWEFDRLGGIASEQFDINKENGGVQFVMTVLGFLWMNEEALGFDPTIVTSGGEQYIEIKRDGQTERLILDKVMKRARCIAGRATTCWKAHRKEDPKTSLVIKDSWQYTDRDEEGKLLQMATERRVVNVARYYHHETVRVHGADDDVRSNVRKGLDVATAINYRPERSMLTSSARTSSVSRKGRSSSAGVKRPSSEADAALPQSKRSCSASPTNASICTLPNRVHRRVILREYGKPIYKASSRVALLAALEGCVTGHESLYNAGFLHRDISINNLMVNEDHDNSWQSFLIDLDLAIETTREEASGARGKTGTRAFMAIGALLDDEHSFMHDLESFFWVLFWICMHYDERYEGRRVPRFEKWNYVDTEELAISKKGVIDDEEDFLKIAEENFTAYYRPLIAWVNRLRRKVFPNGERWKKPEPGLYHSMKDILREAQQDAKVASVTRNSHH